MILSDLLIVVCYWSVDSRVFVDFLVNVNIEHIRTIGYVRYLNEWWRGIIMWISKLYDLLMGYFKMLRLGVVLGLGIMIGMVVIVLVLVLIWISIYMRWYV